MSQTDLFRQGLAEQEGQGLGSVVGDRRWCVNGEEKAAAGIHMTVDVLSSSAGLNGLHIHRAVGDMRLCVM